jgi:hypothetical protein
VTPLAAAGAVPGAAGAPPGAPAGNATLVPEGAPLTSGGIDDALGVLYMILAQQRDADVSNGKVRVDSAEKEQQKALADQQAALAREQANESGHGRGFFSSIGHLFGDVAKDVARGDLAKAANDVASDVSEALHSPAFWDDLEKGALFVAKVAAVVGATVVTAASLGAGAGTLALAALTLSVGGEVVSDTRCLGSASQYVGLGMELAGSAGGLVAGITSTAAGAASRIALHVGTGLSAVGGGAEVVAGGAHVVNAEFAANVESATADAQAAVNRGAELERTIEWVIDDVKASAKTHQDTEQTIESAIQAHDQSTAAAAALISVISVRG